MEKLILILKKILSEENPNVLLESVKEFQNLMRNDPILNDKDPKFIILDDLSDDLEYFEPDYKKRKESNSFYDTLKLKQEITNALDRLKKISNN